jgi:hypothetical protein
MDSDTIANVADFASLESVLDVGFIEYTQGMLELQIATSTDNITFGTWATFAVGDYEARAFRFRLVMRSFLQSKVPTVTALSVTCDMPDRLESAQAVTLASDWNTITFSVPFKAVPNIQVTPTNLIANERVELQNKTASGFEVRVIDSSSGLPSGRVVDWLARGYGKVL